MSELAYIIWTADPVIFTIPLEWTGFLGDRPIVWYGFLFAMGFILSQQIMYRIFKAEGRSVKDVDKLTTYMVAATILGARLGHCLFYNPQYYLSNPIEILKIWEGGLASHGGAIGILIAIWLFVRNNKSYTWFWLLDRLVIVVALTGAFIRTGNLINSEMEGLETKSSYGIIYARATYETLNYDPNVIESVSIERGGDMESDGPGRFPVVGKIKFKDDIEVSPADMLRIEQRLRSNLRNQREVREHVDFFSGGNLASKFYKDKGNYYLELSGIGITRHAAQMYEATYCILIMLLLYYFWSTKREILPAGFNFALFNILLWSLRFVDEFFKMNQEDFEADIPLNMGQWLSIPLFLFGIGVMIYIFKKRETVSA